MTTQPTFKLTILATCLAFLVACGGFEGSSPSAPSAPVVPPAASSGATISGTVNGATSGLAATLTAVTSGITVTVTVVGTNLSTTANAQGRFALEGVPAGDVQLRFTGPGMNATVTVSGVRSGERIEIVVVVNGSTATVKSDSRHGPEGEVENEHENPNEVELKGVVGNRMGSCGPPPALTFTVNVNGVTTGVVTDSSTQFRDGTCTDVQNGVQVEVKGTRSSGMVRASRVEIKQQLQEVELKGVVGNRMGSCGPPPALTFTVNVNGVTTGVVTDSSTQFRDGTCSDVQNGVTVEVKGTRSSGMVRASRVEIKQQLQEVELKGVVGNRMGSCGPPPALTFTVNVSGVTTGVVTDSSTQFRDGTCSDVQNAVQVEVKGTRPANSSPVLASRVEIKKS